MIEVKDSAGRGVIKGKLDDWGGSDANSGSGQIMAFINEPAGRIFFHSVCAFF